MTIRYVDIFTGISATSCALRPLGFVPVAFAEIDDFASAVIRKHYPDAPNLGDVCDVDWSPYKGNVDLVVGGSPCFTAGTLVMCESGLKPIEEVQVGELVLTHKGNLRRVLSVGSKTADTVILKGQGSIGIECTKNHPFFSRTKTKTWVNEDREYRMVVDGNPEWISAENMGGRFWLNVCNANTGAVPEFAPSRQGARGFGYIDDFIFTPEFFYFVGRWLGDGWTTCYKRKGRVDSRVRNVHVCCSYELADELEKKLLKTGLHFCRTKQRTTERFTCHSVQLYDWIVSNFGVGAGGKNIPTWCLSMNKRFREAMVQGYFESDGHRFDGGYKASTISRKLSIGMKMLCGSIGIPSSVTLVKGRGKTIIEGRVVNERESYVSSYYEKARSAFFADAGFYGKVRSVLPGRDNVTVYNLEVEGDHSYTADGIAVHNCQAFSVAGSRGGCQTLEDGSCSSMFDAFVSSCLSGSSGRTSQGRLPSSEERLSSNSSPKWMSSGTVWHGEYSTRSSSAWPNDASVSFLSDTLETCVPARYCLSPKACAGILRRCESKGRPLPEPLGEVLRLIASRSSHALVPTPT